MKDSASKRISRRQLLRSVTTGAVAAGIGGALSACAAAPAAPPAAAPAAPAAPAATSAPQAEATTAPAAAGATEAPAAAGDKAKLDYWTGWSGYEFDELNKLVKEFSGQSKLGDVNMTTVFGQYEKVLTAISAGNPPDIVSAVWMSQLAAMGSKGALIPLDDYVAKAGIKAEDFFPQLHKSWFYDGKQYGVAVTISSTMLVSNKNTLKEAGVDPDTQPKTLADFDTSNQKLFKEENGQLTQIGYVPASNELYLWGNVFGGSFFDEANKKVTANDPKIVAALEWMASYPKKYGIDKLDAFAQGFGDYLSANNALFVGKQPITTAGEWMNGIAKQYAPDVPLGFWAAPPPDGGKERVTNYGGSIFTIPKGAKNPDASWEFIEWLQRPENMERFDAAIGNLPTRIASAAKPEFSERNGFKLSSELLNSPNAVGPIPIPQFDFYLAEMEKAADAARRGTKTPQQALDDLTTLVQEEVDRG